MSKLAKLQIHSQPDDETCGPTALHAIYQYYGFDLSLNQVINTVERSLSGGTLAPLLGKHALKNNFNATIYINNLNLFDPTWFVNGAACNDFLSAKLTEQMKVKQTKDFIHISSAYLDYLSAGGTIKFKTLGVDLLKSYFEKDIPILTGLSATYLYRTARETFSKEGVSCFDDINGTPCGHFVVLCGYDNQKRSVIVADPHQENPLSHNNYYKVSSHRLINAILLGVLTYDANLLMLEPREK